VSYWFLQTKNLKSVSNPIASIAVLPFQNKSSDPDTDYLSDGLAESLIFRLTQLPGLKVSPTTSVMRYKDKDEEVAKIASELGVDAVMTGRILKRGDNLNITVELVDTRNNKSLWGEQYERKMSDLLATQREIAATIAQKLQIKLSGNDQGVTKKYTDNNDAYQLYMKGRFYFARRTKEDMERSIDLYTQATALDPNFALAYVGIAECYTSMPSYPYMRPDEAAPKAKAAIEKALALDPDLPEAHAVAGMVAANYEPDYPQAEREFKRAIELGPDLAITHYRYAWTFLSVVGRHDEAIAEMKRAMELEPLSIHQGANYASVLFYARHFDEALVQARKMYELDPNHPGARNWLCYALDADGRYPEAQALAEAAIQADSTRLNVISACLDIAYARSGQQDKALATIAKIKEAAKTRYVLSYWVAIQYAALGDKDAAFAELEEAFRDHDWFINRLRVDPFMDPLRGDPRFDAMVKRLGLPN
jgi:TolB-like protein/Tfp pilus assembly protein PilF